MAKVKTYAPGKGMPNKNAPNPDTGGATVKTYAPGKGMPDKKAGEIKPTSR